MRGNSDLILLDFSKAFDKVSHEKVLHKLHRYGICGHVLHWIKAFLANRSQTVVLEGEKSAQLSVNSGVPEGSMLGPVLFLVFINDLPDHIRSKVRLFADDTAVYLAVSNLEQAKLLQEDLDRLGEWSLKWDMEFNPSKCTVIHVTRSKTAIPSSSPYMKKKSKRKVQGVPQSQTAALPSHQEEEETDKSKQAKIDQTYEKH